jgi:hypothetical protein
MGGLAGVLLPPTDDDIHVARINFHQPGVSLTTFANDQRRSRAAEEVQDVVAGLAAIAQRALNQLDRLHGRMLSIRRRLLLLPQRRLRPVSVPRILLSCHVAVKDRFVLELVAAKAPGERVFRPDDLAADFEPSRVDRVFECALHR